MPPRVKEMGSKSQGGDGIILRLQAALEAQGFSVFVGESDIEGGDSWTQAIQRAIDGCAIFIPVCSATFGAGGWTYKEVLYALSEHKAMIPVWHSSTYPPPDLKMMIQSFQRVPRGALPLTECDFDEVVTEQEASSGRLGVKPAGKQLIALAARHSAAAA
ncbi:ankyrin-1 [Haematococcus lacustris]|uniref:Ankyrin-1 n=1 Tax=Haematococcus lacustris TaxID=44745 RepID=A0A6A0AB03_HAELA|nr:ankyrin-1 [Haematococcus lacustris]